MFGAEELHLSREQTKYLKIFLVLILLLTVFYFFYSRQQSSVSVAEVQFKPNVATYVMPPPGEKFDISEEEAMQALRNVGKKMREMDDPNYKPPCPIEKYGSGWGVHEICNFTNIKKCNFMSYGISNDYSFDKDLLERASCKGVGLDPTTNYYSRLMENYLFMAIGAPMIDEYVSEWVYAAPVQVANFLGYKTIEVLKMDCEGCEYAIFPSVTEIEPKFFDRVNQLAIEVHVSRWWLNTPQKISNLGKLYRLLELSGIDLVSQDITPCGPHTEVRGCMPELEEVQYPCGLGKMCQNLLFARLPKK